MVIFQYNLYIFGIHFWTVLYPKPCYNEPCYKEVEVYVENKVQCGKNNNAQEYLYKMTPYKTVWI